MLFSAVSLCKLMSLCSSARLGSGRLIQGSCTVDSKGVQIFDPCLLPSRDQQLRDLSVVFEPPLTQEDPIMQLLIGFPGTVPQGIEGGLLEHSEGTLKLSDTGKGVLRGQLSERLSGNYTMEQAFAQINAILGWPKYGNFGDALVSVDMADLQARPSFSFEAVGMPRQVGQDRLDLIDTNLPRLLSALIVHMAMSAEKSVLGMPSNPMSHFLPILQKVADRIMTATGKEVILGGPANLDPSRAELAIKQAIAQERGVSVDDVEVFVKADSPSKSETVYVPGADVRGRHDGTMVVLREPLFFRVRGEGEMTPVSAAIPDDGSTLDDAALQAHMKEFLSLTEEEVASDATRVGKMEAASAEGQKLYIPIIGIPFKSDETKETVRFSQEALQRRLNSPAVTWKDVVVATKFGGAIDNARQGFSNIAVAATMNVDLQRAFSSDIPTPVHVALKDAEGLFSMKLVEACMDEGTPVTQDMTVKLGDRESALLEKSLGRGFQDQIAELSTPEIILKALHALKADWDALTFLTVSTEAVDILDNLIESYTAP